MVLQLQIKISIAAISAQTNIYLNTYFRLVSGYDCSIFIITQYLHIIHTKWHHREVAQNLTVI